MTVRAAPPMRLLRLFPARVLARVTGANVRTAERWRVGQVPQSRYLSRMVELDAILAILGRGMSAPSKRTWLEGPNRALGWERPIDRLAAGDFGAVRAAAESLAVGDMT